jgi:hypothetical protein
MTASCKRHGITPFRYLEDVLRRRPATSPDYFTELLRETHPHAAKKRAAHLELGLRLRDKGADLVDGYICVDD